MSVETCLFNCHGWDEAATGICWGETRDAAK